MTEDISPREKPAAAIEKAKHTSKKRKGFKESVELKESILKKANKVFDVQEEEYEFHGKTIAVKLRRGLEQHFLLQDDVQKTITIAEEEEVKGFQPCRGEAQAVQ